MKRSTLLPELLTPAGSEDALLAALAGGADAVYLGMAEGASNARTLAQNFTREQLLRLIPLCHAHGTKVYVTLNTLVYDRELLPLTELATFLSEAGADALIVADLGLARALRESVPKMPLHASTQAFTHNTRGADALARMGFSRVVLARELSEDNIRTVTKRSLCETEIFLHGALCVSHSGECLFSSLVGGRSGNRGACAQPCRLPYNGAYPLSLKDYSLAKHIPALIESGVASLKIEGRMKSPAYVYGVTRIFRRLLDEGRAATDAEMATLAKLFCRDGFTDGYFKGDLSGMGGIRRAEDKAASREGEAVPPLSELSLSLYAEIHAGKPCSLSLTLVTKNGRQVTASAKGPVPLPAENAALMPENVKNRFAKFGGTGFYVKESTLSLEDGLFLPVGALNALRRNAHDALLCALRSSASQEAPLPIAEQNPPTLLPQKPLCTALFYRSDTYRAVDTSGFDICFLPFSLLTSQREEEKMPNGVALPPVLFDSEEMPVKRELLSLKERGIRYALVGSLGALSLAKECGLIPFGDFRLNIANRACAALYREMGLYGFLASAELPIAGARALCAGVIAYGHIPLMLTERCFVKESVGCEHCGHFALTDRRGVRFPVLREYPHRCLVLNSLPTYLGDTLASDASIGTHFLFTTETPQKAKEILAAYRAQERLPYPVRRAFK